MSVDIGTRQRRQELQQLTSESLVALVATASHQRRDSISISNISIA